MNFLRGLFFENLGLKLVAIVLALVVYLHVYTERTATMVVSFPLEVTDLADSLAVVSQSPVAVAAEFRGTGKQLIRLRLAEKHVSVSLLGVGPGRYQRSIGIQDLPAGAAERLEVTRFIGPQMVEMQIDRMARRLVPVAARIVGKLPPEYTWPVDWTIDPSVVTVSGPASRLDHLDSMGLEPVRLEPGRDTLRVQVGPESTGTGFEMSPTTVTVRVPLVRHAR